MAGNVRTPSRGLPTPGRDAALRAVALCGALSGVLLLLSVVGMLPFGPAGGSALLGGLWILVTSIHLALARPPQARAGV